MAAAEKFSYFFVGLGIGVAVGMLFAPQSGEETRGLLKSKAGEGTDYLKRRSDEVKQTATDYVERGKSALARQKDQLSAAVEAGKQAYKEAVANPEPGTGS